MPTPFPEPTEPAGDRAEVLVRYLDYFRETAGDRVRALPRAEQTRTRLPSGWTPVELANHLRHVEQRWLVWGFEGADVGDPWADQRDGRWYVEPDRSADELVAELRAQGEVTRAVVRRHALDEHGRPGPRWGGAEPPTLERVLLHLLQEYARHVGHLDVVSELAGGPTGE